MRHLDPDDSRAPYLQVADAIRNAVTDGLYAPAEALPSRANLAAHYAVSPMTIQNAVRVLRAEGLVVTRPGSGVYVRQKPAAPRDLAAEIDDLRRRIEALERG